MHRSRSCSLAIAVLSLLVSFAVPADGAGLYGGGGIGNTFFSSDIEDALEQIKKIDENAFSWKLFGGFMFGKFVGVEGGYRSFGEVSSTISDQGFRSSTSGWDLEGMGRLQIAIVDVFAKGGMIFWKQELRLLGKDFEESGTDFLWGLGVGLHLGPIGARVEWESVVIDTPDNLSMVSLSATIGF